MIAVICILVKEASAKISDVSLVAPLQSMKTRKTLKHHLKVIAFDWSPDQRHIYSGGEVSQVVEIHSSLLVNATHQRFKFQFRL